MTKIHVVLAGGSCGNTLYLIEDQLKESFDEWGFDVRLNTQNIWQRFDLPAAVDLVLQTLPAYQKENLDCPVISVRRMIRDRQDPTTLDEVKSALLTIHKGGDQNPARTFNVGELHA
ncbi:MAG: hypothetical protein PVH60_09300 [Anaerolineales bacterium]|jgi:hypothetical protein